MTDDAPQPEASPDTPADATPSLEGARVWLVTDGTAEALGWLTPMKAALHAVGAGSVEVLGVTGMIGMTARGILGQGAEKIARTLRLSRRGQPDATAFEAIEAARPDLILVDHPGVLRTLEIIRDTARSDALHVAVVSALAPLDEWTDARADAVVAPDDSMLDAACGTAIAGAGRQLAGPPVPPGFAAVHDRAAARTTLGLDADARVLLFEVAGMAPEAIDRTLLAVRSASALTLLFHYGTDGAAADALRRGASLHGVRAHMFGHVDDLELYAAAADAVVVGPGDRSAVHFLAIDRPVICLGDELAATRAARSGAIVCLRDDAHLSGLCAQIAAEGVAASWMDAAAAAVPSAPTSTAAAAIAAVWAARTEVRAPAPMFSASASPADTAAEAQPGGRLESIGSEVPNAAALPPLTRAEAKERLAALILDERQQEAAIASAAAERDRWFERLELAQDAGESDLADWASGQVRNLTAQLAGLNDRIAAIRAEKEEVRRRAAAGLQRAVPPTSRVTGPPAAPDFEARFRRLERDGELDRLRRRALDDDR